MSFIIEGMLAMEEEDRCYVFESVEYVRSLGLWTTSLTRSLIRLGTTSLTRLGTMLLARLGQP